MFLDEAAAFVFHLCRPLQAPGKPPPHGSAMRRFFHDPASRKRLRATEGTHPCDLNRKSRRDLTACCHELLPGTAANSQNLRHLRMRFIHLE